jgi:hypothetical protein
MIRRMRIPLIDLMAVGGYVLLSILATFPTAFRLGTVLYGTGGDPLYYIWLTWWRRYSWLHGLDYRFLSLSQAPFGTDLALRAYPGIVTCLGALSIPFGEIAAYNLMILGAYILSGTFAYLLANRLTKNKMISFIAGLVFAFSPYAVAHTQIHVDLAQQWVIPLFLLALFNLQKRQTPLAAALLGGAYAVAPYMNAYYGYHVTIAAVVFAVVETVALWRQGGWRMALAWRRIALYGLAAVVGITLYMPELYYVLRDLHAAASNPLRSGGALWRDELWFFFLSSRPWSFFLPSTRHPLLGSASRAIVDWIEGIPRLDFAPPILANRTPGLGLRWFWYNVVPPDELYLGYVCLAAAGYAIWRWRKGTLTDSAPERASGGWPFGFRYFVVMFVVALLFTFPPYLPVGALLRPLWGPLHNIVIPMPSLLTMRLAPPLRDSSRFMATAMLSLAMLAAVGLDALVQRLRSGPRRAAVLVAFVGLLTFEYFRLPITKPLITPPEYLWLAEQPRDTIVATYPLNSRLQLSYQRIHELPVIDGHGFDAAQVWDNISQIEDMAIGSLDAPLIGPKLAALGVRYVVNAGVPLESPPEGLWLLFTTDTAQVFEVTSTPAPLAVLYTLRDGLWMSDAPWGWQDGSYTIYVWNPLNEAALVNVELTLQEGVTEDQMVAFRTLTPHPEQVIRSGLLIDNPSIPPDYPDEPVLAGATADGLVFRSLTFQPGETTLLLRWSDVPTGSSLPLVTDVHFELLGDPQ